MFLCSWPESAGFCQAGSIGRSGDRLKVWVGQGGRRNGIRSGMIIDQSGGHRLKENREGGKGLMRRTLGSHREHKSSSVVLGFMRPILA